MAYYAFIDSDNVVVKVIAGVDETVTKDNNGTPIGGSSEAWEQYYQNQLWHQGLFCKRTSFNGNIRKQSATIGGTYDSVKDQFVASKPYASWTLDANNDWQPPTPMPSEDGLWWNEAELAWVAIQLGENNGN